MLYVAAMSNYGVFHCHSLRSAALEFTPNEVFTVLSVI
ncbi:hypothetical protein GAGA_3000 [Paraglaciecola agarilytica NO2]|uniref:Uncharacterized protein n=1 Tax=Paraglaciecola agarilytica NO2 TaxID=1125747 RepID=A0ABQ0I9T4_9ALTE|nr:hypothetical protein GAGA_3000 [Paraglaciecola agarilytica NO2]